MTPMLNGFDHVHVYVRDREGAAKWYAQVLGFTPVEKLMVWAVEGGPLTLADSSDRVHLALFEKADHGGSSAIAFQANGEAFLSWKSHLEANGLTLRIADHQLAFSMYFSDPDTNLHEITTYDHEPVRALLQAGCN